MDTVIALGLSAVREPAALKQDGCGSRGTDGDTALDAVMLCNGTGTARRTGGCGGGGGAAAAAGGAGRMVEDRVETDERNERSSLSAHSSQLADLAVSLPTSGHRMEYRTLPTCA